ncbi:Arc family DNA-binding protein [Pseudomonas yamanorum]|nr:Arc family DNA-binding protein [Pseudomonas yamanorum]
MTNSHEKDKFVIRLPDGLRPSISAQAKANHRSMNNEIIHRLERGGCRS